MGNQPSKDFLKKISNGETGTEVNLSGQIPNILAHAVTDFGSLTGQFPCHRPGIRGYRQRAFAERDGDEEMYGVRTISRK